VKYLVILAITAAAVLAASSVVRAEPGKPLRHLVYKLGVTVTTQTEELVMGENGEMPTAGSGVAHYTAGMLSRGTMTADVMGFTGDDALAVQISEQTDNRKAPPVRVDVTVDGQLRINPDDLVNVTEEEQELLRLLARKFLSEDGLDAGRWVHELEQGKANLHEEYRIMARQPNGDLTIALDQRIKVAGAQPYDTTTHGTITYSNSYKVPRSISIDGRTHHEGIQQTETDDTKFSLDLISDSFQPGG